MAATGEGKDRYRATTRKLSLMLRHTNVPGWEVVPGWQGLAAEKRQATTTEASMVGEHRRPRSRESARPGPDLTHAKRVNPARVRAT